MKSTLEQLTSKEKDALARLYETEGYKVLKKIHDLEIRGLGKDALDAPSMETLHFLRGRAQQSTITLKLIRDLFKKSNKES
jgi:hypothetical protein